MAITQAVIDFGSTPNFRSKARLCYWTASDLIIGGTFPVNVTTVPDKNLVTAYASRVVQGSADVQAQVDSLLCTVALQNAVNATPMGDTDTIMLAQAKLQMKLLAGVVTTYT